MKPVIYRRSGKWMCVVEREIFYINCVCGVGSSPFTAYQNWADKRQEMRERDKSM